MPVAPEMQLAIGTAQFGLDYGITNLAGQVMAGAVSEILALASASGIEWLDTAAAYGDAQSILGQDDLALSLRVCTKIGVSEDAAGLEQELSLSLRQLRRQSIDIMLLHRSSLLSGAAGRVVSAWCAAERRAGRIGAFGVSVYAPEEVDPAIDAGADWIQVPISVLDQRWLTDGHIFRLKNAGVRVQARSLLAQGLVVADPANVPVELAALRAPLQALRLASHVAGVDPIDLALGFAAQLPVDMLVFGVQSVGQLRRCMQALNTRVEIDWGDLAATASAIDPRSWPAGMRFGA